MENQNQDFEKLYNEQLAKYQRLRNGVQYGLKKIGDEANEVHNRLQKRANWEGLGKRDGLNKAHSIMVETILEHINNYNERFPTSTKARTKGKENPD
jgi:hypothetical protein